MTIQALSRVNYADIQTEGYGTITDHDPVLGFWNDVETLATTYGHTTASISYGFVKVSSAVKFQHLFLDIQLISPYLSAEFMQVWIESTSKAILKSSKSASLLRYGKDLQPINNGG